MEITWAVICLDGQTRAGGTNLTGVGVSSIIDEVPPIEHRLVCAAAFVSLDALPRIDKLRIQTFDPSGALCGDEGFRIDLRPHPLMPTLPPGVLAPNVIAAPFLFRADSYGTYRVEVRPDDEISQPVRLAIRVLDRQSLEGGSRL